MMNSLNQVLEVALQLPYEQQEMLIEILQNRHYENRRTEIALDARQTLADFHAGRFQPQSAEDVIAALRQSLNESDAGGEGESLSQGSNRDFTSNDLSDRL